MANNKEKIAATVSIKNRKASYEYEFLDKYVAGIALQGTEIKSIRQGKINLQDAYGVFFKGELWLKQLHISPYINGTHYNHDEVRDRKLLLKRAELRKLERKLDEKGLAIIATKLFINNKGLAKVEIALARGKKLYDKRASIKEKDVKRDLERIKY